MSLTKASPFRALALLPALGALGCDFFRYEDIVEDAPVVLLEGAESTGGFGASLSSAVSGDFSRLLVGGSPTIAGAAVYELGTAQQPGIHPIDLGPCIDLTCSLGRSTAGLAQASVAGGQLDLCFLFGVGADGLGNQGVLGRCDDSTEYALAVPQPVQDGVVGPSVAGQGNGEVMLAADRAPAPSVVAGAPAVQHAWFYAPLSEVPVSLTVPTTTPDASYGRSVAVARGLNARLYAVGAPDEGHVYLFRSADGATVDFLGCLGGVAGFGKALAAGPVVGGLDDLVIADDHQVTVLRGGALEALPRTTSPACSLGALPAGALLASFGCGQIPDIAGCASSNFGAALAVGDMDGDGDGEVAVGAPTMKVRGLASAGALLLYDVEAPDPGRLTDVKFISSAEEGDRLGAAVALPRVGEVDVLVGGAPGGSKTALFFCSLIAADGKRCQ